MDSDRPIRDRASRFHGYLGLSLINATKQQNVVELFHFVYQCLRFACRQFPLPLSIGLRYDGKFETFLASVADCTRPKRSAKMDQATHSKIVSFLWGIADDVLRDLFKRGKYPDVILPMCVLRRLDAVLEPTKIAVLEMKTMLDTAGITEQRAALCEAAGPQAFYNTSKFTLRDLKARASLQQLRQDFDAYLDGFSPNVQDILENFKFRNQIPTLSKADALGTLIEKFLDPEINLSPDPVLNGDGSVKQPAMDNHAMGTVFEELVRKFNEDNNEEAGQHWTPRDAVRLMANLVFLPVADSIRSGTYRLYDGACGTGGMLTVAEETLRDLARERDKQASTLLFGQEINPKPTPFVRQICC